MKLQNLKIRPAKAPDIYDISRIIQSAFGIDAYYAIADVALALLSPREAGYSFSKVIVATDGDAIVGVSGLYTLGKCPDGEWKQTPKGFCGIDWVAVDVKYRGKGVGWMLLKEAESVAAQNYRMMFVYSSYQAVEFYCRNGYSRMDFEFPGSEADLTESVTLLFKALA